ncbi:hypothetical protein ACSR9E_03815 [Citrobacter koseri]|uniref:hypothetical protein n=1 Tax=Citrobacter koseri TaxID=545 RepID=UPI0040424AF0
MTSSHILFEKIFVSIGYAFSHTFIAPEYSAKKEDSEVSSCHSLNVAPAVFWLPVMISLRVPAKKQVTRDVPEDQSAGKDSHDTLHSLFETETLRNDFPAPPLI